MAIKKVMFVWFTVEYFVALFGGSSLLAKSETYCRILLKYM